MTAAEAREKAAAAIAAATVAHGAGPLFADFVTEFMRRQERRWKLSTRAGNRDLVNRYLLPFFGTKRVAEIDRADVRRWFDSMSATPGNANRTLPVLSVMMRQAELWDIRPQGSNPCRNMRRYKMVPRERFLSVDELKRLGFVLDHADDRQAAAAIRLLLFTGARSSEITGLQWDWIRGARAILPDSKSGPKAVQLPPPARVVLNQLPRTGPFVFPNRRGDGPMKSKRKSTLAIADYPTRYNVEVIPTAPFLVIPEVSSERREYAPIGWLEPPIIPSNLVRILENATLADFALLTSAMHMAWLRHIGGRLKSDYRYSIGLVYNTFPMPLEGADLSKLEPLAQAVLDARANHPGATLADLYDPDLMPPNLRRAHQALDRAVDRHYRRTGFASERERVEHLFMLYEKMRAPLAFDVKSKRQNRHRR